MASVRSKECENRVWHEQQFVKLNQVICIASRLQDLESQVSEAHGNTLLCNGHFIPMRQRLALEECHLCVASRREFVAVT
jgi:hypothetical protein